MKGICRQTLIHRFSSACALSCSSQHLIRSQRKTCHTHTDQDWRWRAAKMSLSLPYVLCLITTATKNTHTNTQSSNGSDQITIKGEIVDDWKKEEEGSGRSEEGVRSVTLRGKHRASFTHPLSVPTALQWYVIFLGRGRGVDSMVYLRVTAEGCGDNRQALNDPLEAPQVNSLHPGARDYAVAQRRQHYLQHQKQKQQWKRRGWEGANKGCGKMRRVEWKSDGGQKDERDKTGKKEVK